MKFNLNISNRLTIVVVPVTVAIGIFIGVFFYNNIYTPIPFAHALDQCLSQGDGLADDSREEIRKYCFNRYPHFN